MAIDLITGHQGVAHISAEQIASINNALMDDYGVDKVVRLDDGTLTQDGLTINVGTGFWRVNGFDMEIQEAETVYIDPTATGLSRIDNIYVEILQDIPTGAQRSEIVTVQGEAAASPVAPDAPTAPVLNTDILLQVTPLATVTVTEGAMVMTDLSVPYEMVTPQELAAVETIANTANTSANNALGMIKGSSDAYSSSKAYSVGDHVIYNNKVYKCITACSAGSWATNQSCFEHTTLTSAVTDLNNKLSHIGMIIHSTTLDTEEKVKAIYGSNTSWIQHSGYVLRGATSGVTANSATKTSGNDSVSYTPSGAVGYHTLTINEIPSHTHDQRYGASYWVDPNGTGSSAGGSTTAYAGNATNRICQSMPAGGGQAHNHGFTGTAATINTLPNYKSVYIWERTA